MVTSSNSYWFFTVNLWQVKTPLGDDVVPPRDLSERFEKEATPQQQDPPHEESKDSVAEEAKHDMTPQAAQPVATPKTQMEDGSEHPGSEAEEDSETEVPLVVLAPPKLVDGKKFQERLRRVFAPRMDGTFKVPEELVRDWKSKSKTKRGPIESMFEKVGCDPDRVS